ncbi:integrase arm-type DNA-binding domain-containing protein [Aurantiacibacter sp. DGU5]|uniref:Integrase arm-type DNA-binding domain-containing protein n=1 Tax=Aurantiacibacter flavus TaxID=3145232 RepID=A0ABV0CUY7_9SPHN
MSTSGHKSWRYKYRFENKERLLTIGASPEISLADARERRDEAKKLLREGRDPRHVAKRAQMLGFGDKARTLEEVAREWHKLQLDRWKPVHAADVVTSLERDVFPHIGTMPLAEIDKPLLLSVLRKVEARGP